MVGGSGMGDRYHLLGMFLLIGAVLSSSLYSILSRKLSEEFTPVEMTFAMMWVGAILFNIIAFGSHWTNGSFWDYSFLTNWQVWSALLYLGVLSSVIAFFLMNYMLSRIAASQGAAFINLTMLVSVLAGCIILGERILLYQIMGGFMILLGVWGTQRFASNR